MMGNDAQQANFAVADKNAQKASLLVLGIGNTLLSDDGLGPHVIEHLGSNRNFAGSIDILDGGTLSFTLMNEIENRNGFIVIDACELQAEPGTVRVFEGAAMDLLMRSGKRSVHEVALADLLDIARLRGCLPPHRALVGVQPASLNWGLALTKPVAEAVESVCQHVDGLIGRWQL